MKIITTSKTPYQGIFDIDKKMFINYEMRDSTVYSGRVKEMHLPKEIMNNILLFSFIQLLIDMDYDAALEILKVSKESHAMISRYFKVDIFALFSLIRLTCIINKKMLDERISGDDNVFFGAYFYLEDNLLSSADLFGLEKIMVVNYHTKTRIRVINTGPRVIDSVFMYSTLENKIHTVHMISYPFIILEAVDWLYNQEFDFVSQQWCTLTCILKLSLGNNFNIFTHTHNSKVNRIYTIPTSLDKVKYTISLTSA